MAVQQVNPESVFNFKIQFDTTNLDNGTLFPESYHIVTFENSGAFQAVNLPGNRIIIPLTSQTGIGSFWIKLHLPQPNSSDFYVTFCQRATGGNISTATYTDYVNGIPDAYRTALRSFIQQNGSGTIVLGTYPLTVTFIFTVYGQDTNQPSQAQEYQVRFTGIFGGSGGGGTTIGSSGSA
jgi:hypothetical protein